MKIQRTSSRKTGFTLMELMVAMAITTIIVTVLVSITSIALETWNRSRSELRASRQAKGMLDVMARDFEALVVRRGNSSEWLSAVYDISGTSTSGLPSSNASKLIFFTSATDRYDGNIGKPQDLGGDVSCVGYQLDYRDPIGKSGSSEFATYVLSRLLVNPDETFRDLLGKPDLTAAFASRATSLSDPKNFVCENIFQFTITFHVQVTQTSAATPPVVTLVNVPIRLGKTNSSQTTNSFKINGNGIDTPFAGGGLVTADELKGGKITAMEISATVVSDFGVDQLKRRTFKGGQQAEFLAKNSYQYTKLVQLPTM
jgi:prepilin-type N-terminal cleavage/methylation domain-containing protein